MFCKFTGQMSGYRMNSTIGDCPMDWLPDEVSLPSQDIF